MIKSMTGYGRGNIESEQRTYLVEIKSLNHKYSDITIKMPRTINYLEENVRKQILSKVTRGKIEVFISFENNSIIGKEVKINKELAQIYIKELKQIAEENGLDTNVPITEISKMPEVLTLQNNVDENLIWNELNSCIDIALDNFIKMRKEEGERIEQDLLKRINNVEENVLEISKYSTGLVEEYIVKLEARIKELLNTNIVDKDRLAQEIVIYSDKSSIEEELTRLKSHIVQFKKLLKEENAVGKKLDFLMQEMNRETNTIGSKANNLNITNLVIEIKTKLEDIREQIQNIE